MSAGFDLNLKATFKTWTASKPLSWQQSDDDILGGYKIFSTK
jgi:hypothetical protein